MNPLLLWAFGCTALVIAILAFPVLIKLLHRWELLDHPGDHKIHSSFTPSMGGICILLAVALTLLIAFPLAEWARLKYFFIALAIIFVTGLRDDILRLTPWQKLFGQFLPIGLVVLLGETRITNLSEWYPYLLPGWAAATLTILVLVVLTNAYNLIDGIDGLAGIVGAILFACLGAWFWLVGEPFLAVLAAVFCGATIGFLYYNWQPSKIFMGDTGTLPIGFTLVVLLIAFMEKNSQLPAFQPYKFNASIATAICLFVIPVFDTARVVVLRLVHGQSPFKADRNHVHHQLLRIGLTHSQAALTLGATNVAFIALAWFGKNWSEPLLLALVVVGCAGLSVFFYQVEKRNAGKN